MKITSETKLTQKAQMFADGEGGSFMQAYELFADGKPTDVGIVVRGRLGKKKILPVYINMAIQSMKTTKKH